MKDIDILEELKPEKMDLIQLIRTFKREGIENFITIRKEKFETLIKENKELKCMLKNRIKYTNELEKDLFENCRKYVIPKKEIKHILDKAECEDYYCLIDVIEDLSKLLGEDI